MSILHEIIVAKRDRVAELRTVTPWLALRAAAGFAEPRRSLAAALRRDGAVRFLCEIKRASPSAGEIRPEADAPRIAEIYREAGASGISLVTEEQFFRGRPADLPGVRAAGLPVLMKDFLVDPWQVGQARSLGADAVLLIVAVNDRPLLEELRAVARELELEVLVEVHDAAELELAWRLAPELCGVNHRNLSTFEVDLGLGERLLPDLPPAAVHLAESGIRTRADVVRLEAAGFDALLVGESLMRAPDPGAALRELRGGAPGS
jgi:indole-3-glycerol phosphate synthase